MKKAVFAALACSYVPFVFAATKESSAYDTVFSVGLIVSLLALAYCGNRWRLWWFGVQVGDASGREFMLALKWSLISPVVAGLAYWIAGLFK
ncbi:hypothetical protein I5I61_13690 [Pseudomonas nitroreducens]|uniref:Uncharacterized protein n=1 Tax=Pseudomonas nitroreducens TaxID=46680 RepID=A0ABS0KKA2_PSENT|nr:hypothetical protein [Pseudomonas nitroreducens]MBG6288499.1 hypothetical protein [Pseudomonas nitroreducens]